MDVHCSKCEAICGESDLVCSQCGHRLAVPSAEQARSNVITITCQGCGEPIEIATWSIGKSLECGDCGTRIKWRTHPDVKRWRADQRREELARDAVAAAPDTSVLSSPDQPHRRDAIEIRIPLGKTAWGALAVGAVILLLARDWAPSATAPVPVVSKAPPKIVPPATNATGKNEPVVTDALRVACPMYDVPTIDRLLSFYVDAKRKGESQVETVMIVTFAAIGKLTSEDFTGESSLGERIASCQGALSDAAYGPWTLPPKVPTVTHLMRLACPGVDEATIERDLRAYWVLAHDGESRDSASGTVSKVMFNDLANKGIAVDMPVFRAVTTCLTTIADAVFGPGPEFPVNGPAVTDTMRDACAIYDDANIELLSWSYAAAKINGHSRDDAEVALRKTSIKGLIGRGVTVDDSVIAYVTRCHTIICDAVYGSR